MAEKYRSYGGFLTWEQEMEIEKQVREMEENGLERRSFENAYNWIKEHDPEYLEKINFSPKFGLYFKNSGGS